MSILAQDLATIADELLASFDHAAPGALPRRLAALLEEIRTRQPGYEAAYDAFLATGEATDRECWAEERDGLLRLKASFVEGYNAYRAGQDPDTRCYCGSYALGGICAACAEALHTITERQQHAA